MPRYFPRIELRAALVPGPMLGDEPDAGLGERSAIAGVAHNSTRTTTPKRIRPIVWHGVRVALATWLALGADLAYALACNDQETRLSPVLYSPSPSMDQRARAVIADLLARVQERSRALGSARMLARAQALVAESVAAERYPNVQLLANAGRAGRDIPGQTKTAGAEYGASIDLGAPLYDGGRISAQSAAEREQAEAARLDAKALSRELDRLVLAAALERSRFYKHDQVFAQHEARIQCLANGLASIVKADPGRASEQVQAQKALQQVALARERSRVAKAQAELRLRRLVGEPLPKLEGLTTLLREAPDTELVEAAIRQGFDVQKLQARLRAERARTRARRAQRGARVDLSVRHAHTRGAYDSNEWRAHLQFRLPLFDATHVPAIDAGVLRAGALSEQIADLLDERLIDAAQSRIQVSSASARMQDVEAILSNSEQLRRSTRRQWQSLGRRTLFDVMSAEQDHYGLRISQVDAVHDRQQAVARLWSLGPGLTAWLSQQSTHDSNGGSGSTSRTTESNAAPVKP